MDGIDDMEPCERTDIVIVGGGFGGINAALPLDRQLKRGLRAEVTVISRSNFFLFTLLLVEVASLHG
jgi:NADH dehydrogenase